MLKCVIIVDSKESETCGESTSAILCAYCICVCTHPRACVRVRHKNVRAAGGVIKVSNYRQTNERCILFSQTNEWADFDGTQRRLKNVGMSADTRLGK